MSFLMGLIVGVVGTIGMGALLYWLTPDEIRTAETDAELDAHVFRDQI
jgi:hypothetical protein